MTGRLLLRVNGSEMPVEPGTTLDLVVAALTPAGSGVAVAVNDDVVPRSAWSARELVGGDRVEVLTAVPGG